VPAQHSVHLTLGILRKSQAVLHASAFFQLDGFAVPAPAQVTQTVSPPAENRSQSCKTNLRVNMKNLVDESYKIFRFLTFVCLAVIVFFAGLYYFSLISDKGFAISSGVIALLAGVLAMFANKPVEKDDVGVAVDKVLLTYDVETLQRLKQAKEEEVEIRDFIERRSNEIFLLKLRTYLQESVENKYKDSEIAKLITELEKVENLLDTMNVDYDPLQVPDRFKRLLKELNQEEQLNLYMDVFLEMIESFPFLPFKRFFRAWAKAAFQLRKHWFIENLPKNILGSKPKAG